MLVFCPTNIALLPPIIRANPLSPDGPTFEATFKETEPGVFVRHGTAKVRYMRPASRCTQQHSASSSLIKGGNKLYLILIAVTLLALSQYIFVYFV